jgi:hypothetical protein
MCPDLLSICAAGVAGLLLGLFGVTAVDKQVRVKWGEAFLRAASVPRVKTRTQRVDEEGAERHVRYSAVFPVPPTDAEFEHSELGSRDVRRIG